MKTIIKPRNPYVVPAKFRKAGSHRKPFKALRSQDKVSLKKLGPDACSHSNGSNPIPTAL